MHRVSGYSRVPAPPARRMPFMVRRSYTGESGIASANDQPVATDRAAPPLSIAVSTRSEHVTLLHVRQLRKQPVPRGEHSSRGVHSPVDVQRLIVPEHAPLSIRRVWRAYLVKHLCVRFQRDEPMREAVGDIKLAP